MHPNTGKWLILAGIALILIGSAVYFLSDYLKFFGNLPGDIKVEKPGFKFYFPIVTMLIISALVNLVIYFFKRFF